MKRIVSEMKENEALAKILDAFCAPNPTEEQKMICALTKQALLADSLLTFISEVTMARRGLGKVKTDTVKNVVEYVKANHEVQIRKQALSEQEKDALVKQASDRLTENEVWLLGTLAYLGLLIQ